MVLVELIFFMLNRLQILAGILVLLILFSLPLIGAFNKASAFNKFTTGRKATVWDALFVELRVESQCNNQKS
jgi:hypothetical protein